MTKKPTWPAIKETQVSVASILRHPKRITARWICNNWADLEDKDRKLLWGYKQQIIEKTPYKLYCLMSYGSSDDVRVVFEIFQTVVDALQEAIGDWGNIIVAN